MNRGEVDDVEAHPRDTVQPARGGPQRSRLRDLARPLADDGPLRPGKELIPGAVERAFPVHHDRVAGRPGDQQAQREGAEDLDDVLTARGGEAVQRRDAGVPQHRGQGLERGPGGRGLLLLRDPGRARGAHLASGPPEEQCAVGQRQLRVLAKRHLDGRVMPPARDGVAPRLHLEVPQALRGDRDLGAIPVKAGAKLTHRCRRAAPAVGPAQHHARAEHLVPLAENRGANFE